MTWRRCFTVNQPISTQGIITTTTNQSVAYLIINEYTNTAFSHDKFNQLINAFHRTFKTKCSEMFDLPPCDSKHLLSICVYMFCFVFCLFCLFFRCPNFLPQSKNTIVEVFHYWSDCEFDRLLVLFVSVWRCGGQLTFQGCTPNSVSIPFMCTESTKNKCHLTSKKQFNTCTIKCGPS